MEKTIRRRKANSVGALLEEIVKLAAMTAGYYLAKTAGASYVAPYTEVRTKADLRQLMQFACKDHTKTYAVIIASPWHYDAALKIALLPARSAGCATLGQTVNRR